MPFFIVTAVKTSNLTSENAYYNMHIGKTSNGEWIANGHCGQSAGGMFFNKMDILMGLLITNLH
jgi:hypothetical protein